MNVEELSVIKLKEGDSMTEVYYTINEVAERLKVTDRTIRNLIKEGVLQSYKVGSAVRISNEQINAFLESTKNK